MFISSWYLGIKTWYLQVSCWCQYIKSSRYHIYYFLASGILAKCTPLWLLSESSSYKICWDCFGRPLNETRGYDRSRKHNDCGWRIPWSGAKLNWCIYHLARFNLMFSRTQQYRQVMIMQTARSQFRSKGLVGGKITTWWRRDDERCGGVWQ
jgi:hypothetical protein